MAAAETEAAPKTGGTDHYEPIDCDIAIIGAGLAGLSAANFLFRHGLEDFHILEARNRVGGRVISIDLGPHRIELGAMYIHGILGNPIYELAYANKLVDINLDRKQHNVVAFTERGHRVQFNVVQEVYGAYFYFLKQCEEFYLRQLPAPAQQRSVGAYLRRNIATYLGNLPAASDAATAEGRRLREMLFAHLLDRETCISGCNSMHDIDLAEFGSYTELPGGNVQIPGGFSATVECLADGLPPERIHREHTVRRIRWNLRKCGGVEPSAVDDGDGKEEDTEKDPKNTSSADAKDTSSEQTAGDTNSTGGGGGGGAVRHATSSASFPAMLSNSTAPRNVLIECSNGRTVRADHVLVTVPLGVLKERAHQLFDPPLPRYKLDAIARLSFGTVNKIFLQFDRPFLPTEISEVILLWERSGDDEAEGTASGGGVSGGSLGSTSPPPSAVNGNNWYRKMYSFTKVNEVMLLTWVSGDAAIFVETLSAESIAETCTDILRRFLKDPYIPKPIRVIRTRWHSEVNTRGAYTAISLGSSQADIENLAKPIYGCPSDSKPVLLFAGEATHPNFYSTTHGAFLTGRVAAQLLLESETPKEGTGFGEADNGSADVDELSTWIQGIPLT